MFSPDHETTARELARVTAPGGTLALSIESGEAYWDLFSSSYGPTKTLADSLGDRRDDFARAWIDFFEREYRSGDEIVHTREYLFVRRQRR